MHVRIPGAITIDHCLEVNCCIITTNVVEHGRFVTLSEGGSFKEFSI